MHKTANILNALPKGLQPRAKAQLHEIWMAATRDEAQSAFEQFVATYQAKYPKAAAKLTEDREALLAFYDFPAEHWQHLRTINSIAGNGHQTRLCSSACSTPNAGIESASAWSLR